MIRTLVSLIDVLVSKEILELDVTLYTVELLVPLVTAAGHLYEYSSVSCRLSLLRIEIRISVFT